MSRAVWRRLAWLEFVRAFSKPGQPVPGGREMFNMTAISALLIALIALAAATQEGLLTNFANSALGHVPGAGFPLRVGTSPEVARGGDWTDEVLMLFGNRQSLVVDAPTDEAAVVTAFSRFSMYPYVDIEAHAEIILPGYEEQARTGRRSTEVSQKSSWIDATRDGSRVRFVGWATGLDSPLWRSSAGAGELEDQIRTIVLNRNIFKQHFNIDAYVAKIRSVLPGEVVDRWVSRTRASGEPQSLYLFLKQSTERPFQIAEFKAIWIDSIAAFQKIAYLIPAETYRAIVIASSSDGLSFPGWLGNRETARFGAVKFSDVDRAESPVTSQKIKLFSTCIVGPADIPEPDGFADVEIALRNVMARSWVDACLQKIDMRDRDDLAHLTEVSRDDVTPGAGVIMLSCPPPMDTVSRTEEEQCATRSQKSIRASPFRIGGTGLIYAPDRRALGDLHKALLTPTENGSRPFYLSEVYQNSLQRFEYLTATLNWIILPFGAFGLFMLGYFLNFIIGTLVENRRVHYGVLISRGLSIFSVYRMVWLQMLYANMAGTLMALAMVEPLKMLLNHNFGLSEASQLANKELGILSPKLIESLNFHDSSTLLYTMSISATYLLLGFVFSLLFGTVISTARLWRLPMRPSTLPISLLTT